MRAVVQALLLVALTPNAFADAPPSPRKLITVVTADWAATTGELRRWQRAGKSWRPSARCAVVVGKSGLCPRRKSAKATARRRRGASRSATPPATTTNRRARTCAYRVATPELRCVDDPKSPAYNRVTVADAGEKMRRDDELYRYTIFVRHNDERVPGMGSCIFVHVWRDASSPTVGCTAMALDDLRTLLGWVDRDTSLVQLPRAEYEARQRDWDLPQRK